jgi:pimeloyl-ACP methyl ester carboxylesterase
MSTAQSVAPPRTTSGTTSLTSHRAITNKARLAGSADRASRDGPLTPVTDTNQAGPIYTTSRDSLVVDIRSSGSLCKNDQAAGEGCVKRVPRTSEPRDVGSGRRLPLAVEAPARYVHVRRRVIPCEAAAPTFPNHRTHILPGASHYIQEDAPEEIVTAIKDWWPGQASGG